MYDAKYGIMKRPPFISILICCYCLLNASDLIRSWTLTGKDLTALVAFLFWVSPVIVFWYRQWLLPGQSQDRPLLLGLALFLSFNGEVGNLRVLGHAGLACALAALMPPLPFHGVWLASSLSWMPVLDWLGGRFFPGYVPALRILMAALPAWYLIHSIRRDAWVSP